MCFGPVASFTASGVLTAVGAATLKESRSRRERLFAFIPLIFAAHQAIEGWLWLVVGRPGQRALAQALTLAYILIACCVWPVVSPLSLYLLENHSIRRRVYLWLVGFGSATSVFLLAFILTGPYGSAAIDCSLQYYSHIPRAPWLGYCYALVVLSPFFLSSIRPIRILGILNLIFYAVAYLRYTASLASVWCFFAAVLSLNIYFFFRWRHHRRPLPPLV